MVKKNFLYTIEMVKKYGYDVSDEVRSIVLKAIFEERMACGIGACLACVCKTKEKDHHTNVNNKRICKDGPVLVKEEIIW